MNGVPESLGVSGAAHGLALLKLVGALLVVLLAFWVFARTMRQLNGTALRAVDGVQVVGSLSLGPRERLVVVDAGEDRIVLGVTAETITRVHAMDRPAERVASGAAPAGEGSGAAFADRLRNALSRQPT